jgi:hypothetical protein
MNTAEFSKEFDIRFNFVNSNLAFSVNDYEKSVYLTRAQEEILSNYFNPKGNKYQEGFDGNEKRDIDFSSIIDIAEASAIKAGVTPFADNGLVFEINGNVLYLLNEKFEYNIVTSPSASSKKTSVIPLKWKDFQRILTKAYKSPPKRQTWRFIRSNDTSGGNGTGKLVVELIPKSDLSGTDYKYTVRYVKKPQPIVVGSLGSLSVNGVSTISECILPTEIHDEILNRAIEICRIDYLGDSSGQLQINTRTE